MSQSRSLQNFIANSPEFRNPRGPSSPDAKAPEISLPAQEDPLDSIMSAIDIGKSLGGGAAEAGVEGAARAALGGLEGASAVGAAGAAAPTAIGAATVGASAAAAGAGASAAGAAAAGTAAGASAASAALLALI